MRRRGFLVLGASLSAGPALARTAPLPEGFASPEAGFAAFAACAAPHDASVADDEQDTSTASGGRGGASVGGVGGRSLGAAAPGRVLARALPLITSPTPP